MVIISRCTQPLPTGERLSMVTFSFWVGNSNKSLAGMEAGGGESEVSAWADKEPVIFLLVGCAPPAAKHPTGPGPLESWCLLQWSCRWHCSGGTVVTETCVENFPPSAEYWGSGSGHVKVHLSFEQHCSVKGASNLYSRNWNFSITPLKKWASRRTSQVLFIWLCLVWILRLHLFRVLVQSSKADFFYSSASESQFTIVWLVSNCLDPVAHQNSGQNPATKHWDFCLKGSLLVLELARSWNLVLFKIGIEFVRRFCHHCFERLADAGSLWRQVRRMLSSVSLVFSQDVPSVLALPGQLLSGMYCVTGILIGKHQGSSLGCEEGFISSASPGMVQRVNISYGSILGQMECSQNRTLCWIVYFGRQAPSAFM